ncbi:MAG: hypothetical protein WC511_02535 [Candidatus Pacearchaeota archaeon]
MSTPPNVAIQKIVEGVESRWHFTLADNILDYIPDKDDIAAAIYDAADDINSFAPQTFLSVVTIYDTPDTRWKSLLYLGAAKNVIRMLVHLWTQNGFDATIGELNLPSKLGDYKDLYRALLEEFDAKAERLKKTSQKFIIGIPNTGTLNFLYGNSPFIQVFNSRIRLR